MNTVLNDENDEQIGNVTTDSLKIIMSPYFPNDHIMDAIDKHYEIGQELQKTQKTFEARTAQMRLIQRRLFVKLEDKKQGALDGIIMLYKLTQKQIIEILRNLEKIRQEFKRAQNNLSSAILLLQIMIKYLDLPRKSKEGLHAVLVTPIVDWQDQNWEEIISPSLEMLSHIGPLRKNKNTSLDENPSFAITTLDINKFKRNLLALLDRICKLILKPTDKADTKSNHEDDNDKITEENNEDFVETVDANQESEWISSYTTTFL